MYIILKLLHLSTLHKQHQHVCYLGLKNMLIPVFPNLTSIVIFVKPLQKKLAILCYMIQIDLNCLL